MISQRYPEDCCASWEGANQPTLGAGSGWGVDGWDRRKKLQISVVPLPKFPLFPSFGGPTIHWIASDSKANVWSHSRAIDWCKNNSKSIWNYPTSPTLKWLPRSRLGGVAIDFCRFTSGVKSRRPKLDFLFSIPCDPTNKNCRGSAYDAATPLIRSKVARVFQIS